MPQKRGAVFERTVAQPLRRDLLDAAYGVFEVACGSMLRAVKAVSTYRGRDPRDFSLFAFGGNGPVVGAHLAAMMEMRHVVIPPHPGVFSAFGLLLSDLEYPAARGYLRALASIAAAELEREFEKLEQSVLRDGGNVRVTRYADLRYAGQAHELTVMVPDGQLDIPALAKAFGNEHERTYGHQAEAEAVECVTLRVIGRMAAGNTGWEAALRRFEPRQQAGLGPAEASRRAFFGTRLGFVDTPVIRRNALDGTPRRGPLIVEEYDSTSVVPPGWLASLDDRANIHLRAE